MIIDRQSGQKLSALLADKATKAEVAAISASPKGVYATLTDLQTAFPTGNSNLYIVSADGKWYYWSGSAWVAGGVYQSTGLDATTSDKIQKSAAAINYYNYAWNGRPDTTDYHTFINTSASTIDTINKEIRFTPSAKLGQLSYKGVRYSGVKLQNKMYIRFAIKWAGTGNRDQIGVAIGYNGTDVITQYINGVTNSYQYFSLTFDKNTYTITNPDVKIVDYNTTGFAEISVKELVILDLTEQYGTGSEPSKGIMDTTFSGFGVTYFEKSFNSGVVKLAEKAKLADALSTPVTVSKPLYVSFVNEELKVISKYNASSDMLFILGKKGVNNIFDFKEIKLINNTTAFVSEDVSVGTQYTPFNSDNFSPYQITANNNINGDLPNSYHFTGGNHGYDNTGTIGGNSATGRTASLSFKMEGRALTSYTGFANYIEVKWTNYVQATNTKKADGTGREVLRETYKMTYNGIKWEVEHEIEPLEDILCILFYGLEFQTGRWNGGIFYHTCPNKKWNVNQALASDSGDATTKTCNRATVKDPTNTHFVDIEVDTKFGIGNREFVTNTTAPNCFESEYGKFYWNLIKDKTLTANSILTSKGSYKFYSA
jgi:hypothetical protein